MKRFSLLFTFIALFICAMTIPAVAQISGTEGLNMPGSYDSWNNPPTVNAFAGIQKSGGTFLVNNDVATQRYQTLIHAASSGADVMGGAYSFVFSSGPTSDYWANKWNGVTVSMNTLQTYTWVTSGGTDNSITFVDDKYYTVNWKDNGYANTDAIFMETSAPPVSITSVSQSPTSGNVLSSTPVTVTVNISGTKSAEELFYVRYTTDAWSTSTNAAVTFTGTSGTATIPKQAPGTTVSYYIYSTTVSNPTTDHDMYTIKANTNSGSNYSFTVDPNLFMDENFDYPAGDSLNVIHNWSVTSPASYVNPQIVATSGLTYTGYVSSGIGNADSMRNTGQDLNRTFTGQSSGGIYAAFMVNVTAANTAGDYFLHFVENPVTSTYRPRVFVKRDASNNLAFGISKATSTVAYTGFSYSLNTTYLIVIKYSFFGGASNDTAYMWINPTLGGAPEPSPTLTVTDIANSDLANVGGIGLRQGSSSNAATIMVDGLRVGSSWVTVLPAGAVPTITITGTLSDFGMVAVGSNSSEQSYSVSGTNLTDDITITAPTHFKVSHSSGGTFQDTIILNQTGGSVPSTTVYARFSPASSGSQSGNITHTSSGATTQNQAVSGTALEAEPTVQASSVSFGNVNTTSMDVNWTRGNGNNCIVIMKQGSTVDSDPADGTTYTDNSVFGNGSQIGIGNFVVYKGISTSVTVTGLSPSTTYHVAVYEFNNTVENYLVPGATGSQATSAPANSQNTDIIAGTLSIPATISSLVDTAPEQIAVFDFKVRDGSGSTDADAVGTLLNSIRVVKGSSNTVSDWSTTIQGAELFNGLSSLGTATLHVDSISWSGSPIVTIPDDDSLTLTVKMYLNASLPAGSDGKVFEFQINQNSNVTVDASGSFMAPGGTNVVGSPGTTIDVQATQLAFTTQPQSGLLFGSNIAPVAVTAQDANSNKDGDYSGNVTLSSGTFTLASTDVGGLTQAASAGVASWTNLTSSNTGTGTILADASSMTQGVSNSISVLAATVTSVQSGNWSDGTTWDQGSKPTATQTAIIAAGHTVTLTAADTCEAATVQTGGVLDCGNYALKLHGTFTLESGAEAKMSAYNPLPGNGSTPYAFNIASTFTFYGGSTGFSLRNPSVQTVTFGDVNWTSGSNATPAIGTIIAGNLSKSGAGELRGGTSSSPRTIKVIGNVTVDEGYIVGNNGTSTGEWDIDGNLTINANGTMRGVNYTGQGTYKLGGNLINNGGKIKVEDPNGGSGDFIVYFKGTGSANFNPGDSSAFRTITIAPGKTVNLLDTATINVTYTLTDSGALYCGNNIVTGTGNFTLLDGATLGIGSPDGITTSGATGNIQVAGTRTYSSLANYVYNGTVAQVTGDGFPADCNNLTIDNPAGVTLSSNHTVNGVLTLTSGNVITGVDWLAISSTGSISRTSGHIVGNLQIHIPTGTGVSRTFEIGDASNYTPILFTAGIVTDVGELVATVNPVEHPQIATSGIDNTKSVNRYYTFTNNGVVLNNYSATFNFVIGDVDPGATPTNFIAKRWDGVSWNTMTMGTRTATSTQVTGVTSFSNFAIGEPVISSYTILATAGPNGTIDPSGSVIVNAGDDQTFNFYPATCYKVDSVFIDDGYIGAPSSYTFNDVDANHTIHVKFAMKTYTITVTQGANGTITPGTTVVNCGDDLAFTIAPNAGYHVDSVFADDVYVPDSTTSYTFKDIDANHSITAKFAINTYTLDIVVVGSGTVTKDPDQPTYNHGTSVELTAVPDDLSWKFKEWSGDATGTTNPLSIIMDANKNITATFERDSAYMAMYRSFMPESVALDVDNKGKINKYVKRKPIRVDFLLYVVCDSNNVNDLHMEFSHAIEDGFPFGTIPPSTATPAETKNKKWDFAFSTLLNAGDTVYVYGYGNKGKEQKISKYWWSRDGAQLGKYSKIVTFVHNVPKLPMPNRVNALYETFLDGGYGTDGMVVGKIRTDSVKQYGWFQTLKYGDVLKTLIVKKSLTLHTGTPRGFDAFVNAKPLVKQQKSLPPTKHDNKLFAGLVALKFNITASGMGKIPRGFGELIYEDGTSNPLNGLMIREIAAYGDSVMMGQYDEVSEAKVFAGSLVYSNLAATVDSINGAFEGPLDTLYFADSLVFKGYKMLSEVSYLRANPSAIPAVIIPMQGEVPQEPVAYALYQNYPNPFNPITTIQFDLPEEAIVTLKVYNMLGQEIATLLDREEMTEGTQEVEFSAETLASGIYFYRLVAEGIDEDGAQLGSYQTVKKMILIR